MTESQPVYSIWLTPSAGDARYLGNIIAELSESHQAPRFPPHCTLYGRVPLPLQELIPVVQAAVAGVPEFTVAARRLNHSPLIWKTVFIELHPNRWLRHLNEHLTRELGRHFPYEFKPHLSLIYKVMPEQEKRAIIQQVDVKQEYRMSIVEIVRTGNIVSDWNSDWRVTLEGGG
jgi:2'-5' RNA ligase